MITINAANSAFENMVDLVVENQGEEFSFALNEENIEFGLAEAYSDEAHPEANTSVVISALLDKGYSGDVTVTYRRLTLAEARTVPSSQIEVDTAGAEEDQEDYQIRVKAAIASAMQLVESEIEFEDAELPIPSSENNPVTINILPVSGSLLYTGAAFAVTFAAIDVDIPLDQVITVTQLDGFDF